MLTFFSIFSLKERPISPQPSIVAQHPPCTIPPLGPVPSLPSPLPSIGSPTTGVPTPAVAAAAAAAVANAPVYRTNQPAPTVCTLEIIAYLVNEVQKLGNIFTNNLKERKLITKLCTLKMLLSMKI